MTDTCAHLALGWPAGEVGRHAAQRLRERVTPEVARAALEAMGTFDVTELLPRLEVPTLVLHRSDIPGFRSTSLGLASRIPDARLSILEGESTAPYLGDTEAAASAIDEFFGEGKVGRAAQPEADALLRAGWVRSDPGLSERPDGAGGRGAAPPGWRKDQRRDRRRVVCERPDRRTPRGQHLLEDRRQGQGQRHGLRSQPEPDLALHS